MVRSSRKNSRNDDYFDGGLSQATKRGLWILFLFGLILLFIFSFFGAAGIVGEWVDKVLAIGFGWVRIGVPLLLSGLIYYSIKSELFDIPPSKYIGMLLLFLGVSGLLHIFIPPGEMQVAASDGLGGGYLGFFVAFFLERYLGFGVSLFVVFALMFSGFLVFFNLPLTMMFIGTEERPGWLARMWHRWQEENEALKAEEEMDDEEVEDEDEEEEEEEEIEEEMPAKVRPAMASGADEEDEDEMEVVEEKPKRRRKVKIPLELLDERQSQANAGDIDANVEIIHRTLENFNIPVEMGEVNVGPTVTQYTLKPAEGIKLTRILALNNDLALALAAHPIRIEAPIPGRSLIGIEVPNRSNALIGLKQLMMSREIRKAKKSGQLLLPLGQDVAGKPTITALEKMPHMLVAGATGSGKSVFVNGVILSLVYQHGPDDLKFIMVDPKRVELPVYNRIPHLLTPVITDVKKTINALKWLIAEMDQRYETLAAKGKRNIADYNEVADHPLPYIVLIIDELADLMIVAANDIETYIIRLAQMARAVGIHLLLATQRPSVDVITGLLKANIPGRVAFSVASAVDSRTILDTLGAEKLVGRGDMLFSSAEFSKPKRIQAPYVSEHEVKRVVSFLVDELGEPEYLEEVTEKQQMPTAFTMDSDDGDDLFEEAKEIVIKAQKASTSYLQRKLRIGYARAARLMDLLEDAGVVGSQDGSKAREVLIRPGEDGIIETEEESPDPNEDDSSEDEAYEEEEIGEEEEDFADDEEDDDEEFEAASKKYFS